MQCEFTKAELLDLDFAVMDRGIKAKMALAAGQGDEKRLQANIERIDALHKKLDALIEQSRSEER